MREMKDSGVPWIGEIPADWTVSRVKYAFIRKNDKAHQDNPVVLSLARAGVRVRDLSNNEGQIAESYYDYNPVDVGDLLLNPMDLFSGANCSISRVVGVISPAYVNLRYKDGVANPSYYDYYFKTQYWAMAMFVHGKGVSFDNRWTLGIDTLFNYCIPAPSLPEQQRIAEFLDNKCAEIDSILENTRASIEEYKKLKQSVITEAVTKGIRGERPMKDSGVEWIGQIPSEWSVEPLWGTIRRKTEVQHSGEIVLSLYRDYGVLPKDSRDDNHNVTSLDTSNYKFVEIGDLVVNKMKAWQGSMAISQYQGIVSPAYHVCEIRNPRIYRPYLHYLLRNHLYLPEYLRLSTGMRVGQWDLSYDDLKHIPILIPDLEEQRIIASYLDEKCAAIDSLIASKEALITELETYKKSLIYEYVTGKKEVSRP